MKKFTILLLCFITFFAINFKASAWEEVHDSQANSQLSGILSDTNQSLLKEIETALNTAKQVEADLKNLTKFSGGEQMTEIKKCLQELNNLKNTANGVVKNWKDFSNKWDTVCKDYKNMKGLSASEIVKMFEKQKKDKEETTKEAMQAQGLIGQIDDDSQSLSNLLTANEGAVGALQAAQIGNQMAALQISNLMRLEQMISASNTMQMQYLLDKEQQADAMNAWVRDYMQSSGYITTPIRSTGFK